MHFEQENGPKPFFGPFLPLNDPFLGHGIFSGKYEKIIFLDLLQANLMQKIRTKLMAGSMRTFVTDRTDGQAD